MPKQTAPTRKPIPQFHKEDRREFRYSLSVACAFGLSWLFWLLPGPIRGWIADRFGDLFFRVSSTYPKNVRENVETVEQYMGVTDEDSDALVRSIFRTSARNFMDLITMPRQSHETYRRSVRLVHGSWDILENAIDDGKGAVLFTGHLGCFDYIGQALASRGYKLTVVTGRTTSRFIFDGVTWLRGAKGMQMVEPTPSGIRSVMKALRRNEFAVFVTDRDFFQNGLDVVFMGHPTTLPPGPVRIARQTGAPLIPIFSRRTSNGHELTIADPFNIEQSEDQTRDLGDGMNRVVAALEAGITSSLDQWVMFQRVWLERERVPVRVFPVGSPLESDFLERVASALPDLDSRSNRSSRERPGEARDDSTDS